METKEFLKKVEEQGWDWAEGEHNGMKGYFVKSEANQIQTEKGLQPACIHYAEFAIKENDWDTIRKQMPSLTYMTRIVGYFSKIHNWNVSKKGELKDRHIGAYKV
ncbi:anaerobic ribonucleoside-triphosphate reductase [bacterium]|nr:anaerobic ribonucleoside-triphosphate reductase [bacterium]